MKQTKPISLLFAALVMACLMAPMVWADQAALN